jgi:hypothetical protein
MYVLRRLDVQATLAHEGARSKSLLGRDAGSYSSFTRRTRLAPWSRCKASPLAAARFVSVGEEANVSQFV